MNRLFDAGVLFAFLQAARKTGYDGIRKDFPALSLHKLKRVAVQVRQAVQKIIESHWLVLRSGPVSHDDVHPGNDKFKVFFGHSECMNGGLDGKLSGQLHRIDGALAVGNCCDKIAGYLFDDIAVVLTRRLT